MKNLIYFAALACFLSVSTACISKNPESPSRLLDLNSPFKSSVEGLDIYNSHVIAQNKNGEDKIIRGMRPKKEAHYQQLKEIGITDVLILKENVKLNPNDPTELGDVDKEKILLKKYGIHAIEMPIAWKNIDNYTDYCEQTQKIMQLFIDIKNDPKRKLFFHCTVGEDRTGFLTGIYKSFYEKIPSKSAFDEYMCRYGYADGNPQKPVEAVVNKIHNGLTPIYIELTKALTGKKKFAIQTCKSLPTSSPSEYWQDDNRLKQEYKCAASDLYESSIR